MEQTWLQPIIHQKRDFNITAAIITAIVAVIAGASTAAVALTQTITIAEALNEVVSHSAEPLCTQELLNQHLYQAVHILQQQLDLLAEETQILR